MIYGVGTDLINSKRVEKLLNKFENKFLTKIFSVQEIKIQKVLIIKHFIFLNDLLVKKLFGRRFHPIETKFLHFNEIEILSKNNGRPYINLIGKTKKKILNLEKSLNCKFNFHISISDEKPNALAFVIIFLAHIN